MTSLNEAKYFHFNETNVYIAWIGSPLEGQFAVMSFGKSLRLL